MRLFGKGFWRAGAKISLVTQTRGCVARTQFRPSSFHQRSPFCCNGVAGESLSARESGGILGSRRHDVSLDVSAKYRGKVLMATDNAH
jgi:hypothetical protein